MVIFSFVCISYTKINKAKSKKVMRLAENESRQIGLKFEALVELSPKRSGAGYLHHLIDFFA
jgi:hypothetical protein